MPLRATETPLFAQRKTNPVYLTIEVKNRRSRAKVDNTTIKVAGIKNTKKCILLYKKLENFCIIVYNMYSVVWGGLV